MGRMIIDAATSLDGFWADARGNSVLSAEEMHRSGMLPSLKDVCGAVVMSRRSFDMVRSPDWFAENYELQVPIFVVTELPPERQPRENARLTFHFVATFAEAFEQAERAAGDKAVLAVGEATTVQAALLSGAADEMWPHGTFRHARGVARGSRFAGGAWCGRSVEFSALVGVGTGASRIGEGEG